MKQSQTIKGKLINRLIFLNRHAGFTLPAKGVWHQLRETFKTVETFCLFIGYSRSGHTIVMALLDAHPEVIIGNEAEVVGSIQHGMKRPFIYALLLESSRNFAKNGATWQGYSYAVPNQMQGRYDHLRVIGNKNGGNLSRHLDTKTGLLDTIIQTIQKPLKIIHVIRNPFDNIATMHKRSGRPLDGDEGAIARYFLFSESNMRLMETNQQYEVLHIHLEDLIEDTRTELSRLCDFIGVDYTEDYLQDCASIIYKSPNKSREKIAWSPDQIAEVERRIAEISFLQRYSFTS